MTNRTIAVIIGVILATCVAACNDSPSQLPAGPTAAASPVNPSPVPATVAQERWNLTRTYTGHTGSEACLLAFDGIVRTPSDSLLLIQRSGVSTRFLTADHNTYVGTVAGDEFFATEIEDSGSTLQCGGSRLRFRTEARVSGRFSSDGRALVGEETSVFLLESGATIVRHWDWSAKRSD